VRRAAALALFAIGLSACVPDAGRPDRTAEIYRRIVDSEDARPPMDSDRFAALVDATDLGDPFLRRVAVRALGRLENPALAEEIVRHLGDGNAGVRAAAATALAQAVHGGEGGAALPHLVERVAVESDAGVRGALARALGSLRLDRTGRHEVEEALVALGSDSPPEETLVGVALGFESLTRLSGGEGIGRAAAELLAALLSYGGDAGTVQGASRVRAMSAEALGRSRRLSLELVQTSLADPSPEVRRVVVAYLDAVPPSARDTLLAGALADTSARVAIAAVRYVAAGPRTDPRCERLIAAAEPERPAPVRIVALEALARPCPTPGPQRSTLIGSASELGEDGMPWQPAAHALLSLASIDLEATDRALRPFVAHESPFVRAYAARAASRTRNVEALFTLAVDASPNVRNEAVQGLFGVDGHGLDDFLMEELDSDDPQLLITVSRLLEGAPDAGRVAEVVLATFERISRAERETWRDPRLAFLTRLEELGDASLAERLTPYLRDFDAAVATRAAEVLRAWTGRVQVPSPEPLPRAPVPTLAELRALQGATLTLHMQGGGQLVIQLTADEAPTNVARLVRLAEGGYYDGLSFHRWVPDFVIQGGSPSGNEYQGDGPYTRDEVAGIHWRGTVGLSTRGRDTGDGQIFVNLVHNPRLDGDYTVMGILVDGYDVLDSILEGTVIERAEVGLQR
jgi:cyclophilin family peptidyl-prolyl cis-trans isomerase/HEAT repeat protein